MSDKFKRGDTVIWRNGPAAFYKGTIADGPVEAPRYEGGVAYVVTFSVGEHPATARLVGEVGLDAEEKWVNCPHEHRSRNGQWRRKETASMKTEPQTLAIREEMPLARPDDVIAGAREQAKALMAIVEDRKLFAIVSGKKYLEAEAWEIICAFNNVAPDVVWMTPIYKGGIDDAASDVIAYECKVNLIDIRTGALRGSGISECAMDSFPTRGRTGRDRDKAAKSAAQTWAISKAARMAFSWVAVLAEYEPTPAAEMRGGEQAQADPNDENYCAEHDTLWFKRGKMRGFAHPDPDDDDADWCRRPSRSSPPSQAPSLPAEADTGSEASETQMFEDSMQTRVEEENAREDFLNLNQPSYGPDPDSSGRRFTNMEELKAALKADFGITTKKPVNEILFAKTNDPSVTIDTVGDLGWVYATVKAAKEAS